MARARCARLIGCRGPSALRCARTKSSPTVRIPALSPASRWSYYKVNRKTGEFAQAIAALIDDPRRGMRRGLIGATDGIPYVFAAGPLIDRWDEALADAHLTAAGLTPDTYEYQIHATALRRAVARLSEHTESRASA